MRNCKYLIIGILLLSGRLSAQDITGLWQGTLYNDTARAVYRYEIAISEEKGKLSGFSHTWFIVDDKQYYGVKRVRVKKKDGKIIVEDAELIANNYPIPPAKNVRQLNVLTLQLKDSVLFLTGPFTTNRTKEYLPLTGTINIQLRNDFRQSALVPHLQELSLAKNLSFVQKEENDIAKNEIKPGVPELNLEFEKDIAKREEEEKEKEKQDAVLTDMVVNKKEIKKEKPIVKKEKVESKNPVAVNRKIVPVPTEVVKIQSKPVENTKTVKEDVSIVKNTEKQIKQPVTIPPVSIKKEEVVAKIPEKVADKTALPLIAGSTGAAVNVNNRSTVLQQTVYFKSDSLQLSLYDNGEIDGDTVSVLMNGNIIFAKERLSTNAIRKTIVIDPVQDSIQLVMYAENLGSIPPNTGLLIVRDGKDIYEIRFSGDFRKNAAIVFRRK